MSITEANSVQQPIVDELIRLGWTHIRGDQLDRRNEQVFIESDLVAALTRLNPLVGEEPSRVEPIVRALRTVNLSVQDDGLVEANRSMSRWLRGLEHVKFSDQHQHVPITLIDFEDLSNNTFVVADEVTFGSPAHKARFDIVLFVNGIPLVVGECKTVGMTASWLKAATDIAEYYQPGFPAFFVPNVFSFGTEGKELGVGPVQAPVDAWDLWGPTQEFPRLAHVLESVRDLLSPRTVLTILADYTLYELPEDNATGHLIKLIPRDVQFQAVELMAARAHEGVKKRGLIYHTQGSGKTLAMVWAAGKMLNDPALQNPTVVLVADRIQLVRQAWDQFRTTGGQRLNVATSNEDLRRRLASHEMGGIDQRGLIFTTVHKFAGAPADMNLRENIIILVDEAHRTQEGGLGTTMRAALPNAFAFGFSGTPIADKDRNTFVLFGDPDDERHALHTYSSDQAIADGVVVPIYVAPRPVEFALDKEGLDEAFAELAETEGLSEEQAEKISRRTSRVSAFFTSPQRVAAVCQDIVDYFYTYVDPSGMKAQIVVYDRAACVAYHRELTRLLDQRHAAGHGLDEAEVVMTVTGSKEEDEEWAEYRLTEAEEEDLLARFRTYGDPLKFLIVTSKLGTGFNAPIEGVMFLDKPLKAHTLFQTITRANRNWTNPETDQPKRHGIIVDYIGLGDGFAKAMAPANPNTPQRQFEVDGLLDAYVEALQDVLKRFSGIDVQHTTSTTLIEAQERINTPALVKEFAAEFLVLHGIWETLHPNPRLIEYTKQQRFLAKVYESVQPSTAADDIIWQKLGPKTLALVHDHISDVKVDTTQDALIVADAETIKKLGEQGLLGDQDTWKEFETQSAADVLDTITKRLKKRLEGPNGRHHTYRSLADRLDELRKRQITQAQDSIEWLRELFEVATDFKAAEKAEDEHGRHGLDLLDPRIGALTQIFNESAPPGLPVAIEKVVHEIDEIVREVVDGDDWVKRAKGSRIVSRSLRQVLKKYGLNNVPGLFDRAFKYISEHY